MKAQQTFEYTLVIQILAGALAVFFPETRHAVPVILSLAPVSILIALAAAPKCDNNRVVPAIEIAFITLTLIAAKHQMPAWGLWAIRTAGIFIAVVGWGTVIQKMKESSEQG